MRDLGFLMNGFPENPASGGRLGQSPPSSFKAGGTLGGPLEDSAIALDTYLRTHGCDKSQHLRNLIIEFQVRSGVANPDGDYGPTTRQLLAQFVDSDAMYTGNCFTSSGVTPALPPAQPPPAQPPPAQPPPVTPVIVIPPAAPLAKADEGPNYLLWLLALAAGAGLVWYLTTQGKRRRRGGGAMETRRRRRNPKRRRRSARR